MNRTEFLNELAQELVGMPEEERSQALQFYTEYLEDAGEENVQAVLDELGSPQQLARQLIANCGVPETPAEAPAQQPQQPPAASAAQEPQQKNSQQEPSATQWEYHYAYEPSESEPAQAPSWNEPSQNSSYEYGYGASAQKSGSGSDGWLWIVIAVLTAPLWLGVVAAVAGILIGVVAGVLGMVVGGIAAIIAGLAFRSLSLSGTLMTAGAGLVSIALGLMLTAGIVWCVSKLLPLLPRAWQWLQNTLNSKRR